MLPRHIQTLFKDPIIKDKMILLSGPRQVGKTTLARQWLEQKKSTGLYYNWDREDIRRAFFKNPFFFESALRSQGTKSRLVLDEIHKTPRWKTILKGYFDSFGNDHPILVTGSARLETFHKSGDSLLGRYHLLHLGPLTPHEAAHKQAIAHHFESAAALHHQASDCLQAPPLDQDTITTLVNFSGFPHIFLKQSKRALNLWHREYHQRLFKEDIRDLARVQDLLCMEHLFEILKTRVGYPVALNSLREDLAISHSSVVSSINILARLFCLFLIRPYHHKIQYALKKEPKCYFYDWTLCSNIGSCYENFLAVLLQNYCSLLTDGGWGHLELYYLRDKQKREADFLVVQDNSPLFIVEAKTSETNFFNQLEHFSNSLNHTPCFVVTLQPNILTNPRSYLWQVSLNRFVNILFQK